MNSSGLTLALIARIPRDGVAAFQAYEETVLGLLGEHGGTLQRRLRNASGGIEIHVVAFASREDFAAFRADPRRAEQAPLLDASGASIELIEVSDVLACSDAGEGGSS